MIHVAVIHRRYTDAILEGTKTIESRLSRVRCDPFGAVRAGDRIYFKTSGGGVVAVAVAGRVESFDSLTPRRIVTLRKRFGPGVAADGEYWNGKRLARFATMIHLHRIEAVCFGPKFPAFHGRAWRCLPESADVYPACLARPMIGVGA